MALENGPKEPKATSSFVQKHREIREKSVAPTAQVVRPRGLCHPSSSARERGVVIFCELLSKGRNPLLHGWLHTVQTVTALVIRKGLIQVARGFPKLGESQPSPWIVRVLLYGIL